MYSDQLQSIINSDSRTCHQFLGVFAADLIPQNMSGNTMATVNCCNHNMGGEHWIALFMNNNGCLEFFDSYALSPNTYNLKSKLPKTSQIVCNKKRIQGMFTEVCGYYCLYYIYFKARGYQMGVITEKFSNDFPHNDNYVYNQIKILYNL